MKLGLQPETDPGAADTDERTLIRSLRAAAVVGGALGLIGTVAIVADGHAGELWSELSVALVVFAVFFAVVVWLVSPRQPRNPVVWTMAASAFFSGVYVAGLAAASSLVDDPSLIFEGAERLAPAELPRSAARILMVSEPSVVLALFPLLTFGLLLFPDGRLPSPHWRWAGWFAGVSIVFVTVGFGWGLRPSNTQPADAGLQVNIGFTAVPLAVILSLVALVVRYRGTTGVTRQQFKWVVWGTSIFGPVLVAAVSVGGTRYEDLAKVPFLAATAVFLISYGIAVGKYRIYDVDVVISKSVTYLGLAAVITLLYATVVVGPLLVIGLPDEGGPGLALPLVATGVVAVLFEPIRTRTQRWANRLVYGKRSTPHEVLSQLTARLGETAEDGTDDLARLLAEGTGADQAAVWLRVGDTLHPNGVWPADRSGKLEPCPTDSLLADEFSATTLVQHGDELLGALSITKPRNDPVTPADTDLLTDVAASSGLVLRNISLNSQLEERAHQVRASRQRLIAAQDAERHRLERNLHDGAQQQVVALKVKLGLARTIAEREDAGEVASVIATLANETQDAVDAMRAVAHGIYPPLLEAEGLEPALSAIRRSAAIAVDLNTTGIGRYSRQVEESIYFCVQEIITQSTMAGAAEASISVGAADGDLELTAGYGATARPADLTTVADRIDAAEGTFTLSSIGDETRIDVILPARRKEPA